MAAAPRPAARLWRGSARGACLALALVAAPAALVLVAAAEGRAQDAVSARFEQPVTRYGHNVLGAEGEYDTLAVTLSDGRMLRALWTEPMVFEDVAPRLWDLDGDGAPEVVAVESHARLGARLAIWKVTPQALVPMAATPFIGTRFRWLAPLGAADLDGDGTMDLAYVDRPHLARVLRVWRVEIQGDTVRLTQIAARDGLSNHRIGEDFISGGLRDCGTGTASGPEIVTADADWAQVMVTRLTPDGDLVSRAAAPFSPAALARVLACAE